MTKINRKIQERLRAGLRCFKPLLKAAKERDASRADTGKTRPETPIVLAFDLSHMQPGRDSYIETLFLLTREGHKSAGLNHFRLRLEVTNRHYLGAMMLSDPVVTAVRRELRKLNPGLQITPRYAKTWPRASFARTSQPAARPPPCSSFCRRSNRTPSKPDAGRPIPTVFQAANPGQKSQAGQMVCQARRGTQETCLDEVQPGGR